MLSKSFGCINLTNRVSDTWKKLKEAMRQPQKVKNNCSKRKEGGKQGQSAVTGVKFLKNRDCKDFGGDDIVHK